MIVKFDHIAYTCRKDEIERIREQYTGYTEVFHEIGIPNLAIKHLLMTKWKENHDIVLIEKKGALPIEITAYEDVEDSKGKYYMKDHSLTVNTLSYEDSYQFYEAVGFGKRDDNEMLIQPVMDTMPIRIKINEKADVYSWSNANGLDCRGFCCLAFITNKIAKEKERLDRKKIRTTDIMPLELHGRKMRIFFADNDFGDICEFIGVS